MTWHGGPKRRDFAVRPAPVDAHYARPLTSYLLRIRTPDPGNAIRDRIGSMEAMITHIGAVLPEPGSYPGSLAVISAEDREAQFALAGLADRWQRPSGGGVDSHADTIDTIAATMLRTLPRDLGPDNAAEVTAAMIDFVRAAARIEHSPLLKLPVAIPHTPARPARFFTMNTLMDAIELEIVLVAAPFVR